MRYQRLTVLAGPILLALAGCAGSGAGLDSNGNPGGSGSNVPLTANLQSIQENVFSAVCVRCHSGAGAPEGLQLDAGHSYSLLVGVPSAEQPDVLRVKPGDPDNSYIIRKLEGAPGISGVRMPAEGPPYLPQSTIDVIRQWITNGAPQPTAGAAMAHEQSQPFTVTATSPQDGAVVTSSLPAVVIAFNHEIDASLVNETNVMLERLSVERAEADLFATPSRIAAATNLARGNPTSVLMAPRAGLAPGVYRVTVRGTGGGAFADVNAQGLRADYTFTFIVEPNR